MLYQEFPPPDTLSNWVECVWMFSGGPAYQNQSEVITADGFPECIIHLGTPYLETAPDSPSFRQAEAVVSGQLTKPLFLFCEDHVEIVAIRFKPAGLAAWTSLPMKELCDSRIDARHIFSDLDELVARLREGTSTAQRLELCFSFLHAKLLPVRTSLTGIERAAQIIAQHLGDVDLKSLARHCQVSLRALQLQFAQYVGVSPKQFARVIRFRHAHELLQAKNAATEAALAAGFYDQSHLIRDFKQFAGDSPRDFLNSPHCLSHSLTEPA